MDDKSSIITVIVVALIVSIVYSILKGNKNKEKYKKKVIKKTTYSESKTTDDIIQRSESFLTKVVSIESEERQELIKNLKKGQKLTLLREAANFKDPNATLVLNSDRKCVGYISKDVSKGLAPLIDEGVKYEGIVYELNYSGGLLDLIIRLKKVKKDSNSNPKLVSKAKSKNITEREIYDGDEIIDKYIEYFINKMLDVSCSKYNLNEYRDVDKIFDKKKKEKVIRIDYLNELKCCCMQIEYIYGFTKNLLRVWMEELIIPKVQDVKIQQNLINEECEVILLSGNFFFKKGDMIDSYIIHRYNNISENLDEDIKKLEAEFRFFKLRNDILNTFLVNVCISKEKINRDYKGVYGLNMDQLLEIIESKIYTHISMIVKINERDKNY